MFPIMPFLKKLEFIFAKNNHVRILFIVISIPAAKESPIAVFKVLFVLLLESLEFNMLLA